MGQDQGAWEAFLSIIREGLKFAGSAVGGSLINIFQAIRADERFAEFTDEMLEPIVRRIEEIDIELGDTANDADVAAELSIQRGDELFDPDVADAAFNQAMDSVSESLGALPGQVRTESDRILDEFGTGAEGINRGFGEQLTTARDLVRQLGDQERRDINTQFDAERGAARMDLVARGIGGSTVRQSQDALFATQRRDALGRLQDQTVRQQLGVEETFGLAGLNARTNLLTNEAQIAQNANTLSANTTLQALTQQGNIGIAGINNRFASSQALLDNRLKFGRFGADTRLGAAGLRLQGQSAIPLIIPQGPQLAQLGPA